MIEQTKVHVAPEVSVESISSERQGAEMHPPLAEQTRPDPVSVFSVRDLHVYYGDFRAVRNVDIEIYEHQITAFISKNRAGSKLMQFTARGVTPSRPKTRWSSWMGK